MDKQPLTWQEMHAYGLWLARLLVRLGKARDRLQQRGEDWPIVELTRDAYSALLQARLEADTESKTSRPQGLNHLPPLREPGTSPPDPSVYGRRKRRRSRRKGGL